jgi:MULE transposase domain
LSFSRFDNKDTYDFLFDYMNARVFGDVVPPPRVIVADQEKGFIASYTEKFPKRQLQHCEWHAAENIRAAITRARYTKQERQDLHYLTWNYIKSSTTEALETNRLALCDKLREEKVDYIRKNWLPKEAKIIKCYTKLYTNLGVYDTSRTEGLHPVFKEELSLSTPLPLAIKRVAKAVTRVIKEFAKAE